MHITKLLTDKRFILPLLLIAGLLIFNMISTYSTSDVDTCDQDKSYLLDCGYIHLNIENTIFNPNFILFLSKQQQKHNTLSNSYVENAVSIWNSDVADKRKKIRYQQEHFNKLAMLSVTQDDCDDEECEVDGEALAILHYWMSDIAIAIKSSTAIKNIKSSELKRINIDNDKYIDTALEKIIKTSVGKQLLVNALNNNITIRSKILHNQKGYFDCRHRVVVIDPTVASYIFKINCIIHELVHATNPDNDNSIFEETIAEIIGMRVQDNITDIDISCSPYVIFTDRLLDQDYGNYPVRNNIEKHLDQAGIVIHVTNE